MVTVSSAWIDLCSPDPLIADVSRQVLALEIAYAAFCGVSFVVIPGPRLHHGDLHSDGVMHYARAVQDALSAAPYMQIHIWLRMVDSPDMEKSEMGDLAPFARPEFLDQSLQGGSAKVDLFGTWDAWNAVRTMCKYNSRLCIGKNQTAPSRIMLPSICLGHKCRRHQSRLSTISPFRLVTFRESAC